MEEGQERWKNLKRVEHHLSPPSIPGTWLPEKSFVETFQTNHQVLSLVTGPFAAHVPMSIHHPQLQHPKGMLTSRDIFPVSLITWFIVCRAPNVHRNVHWRDWKKLADRFREHRRDVIKGRNDLPVPAHFNQANHTLEDMKVAVLKAGLANQEYRKKQEILLICKYGTVAPCGLNLRL